MARSAVANWAPHKGVNPFVWLWFVLRSTCMMLVVDNPLSWILGIRGDLNKFDDIEGPFFIQGAPERQVDDGQAVLASTDVLNKQDPFLLILEVRDTKGELVKNATIDAWQADSVGTYFFFSWTLRGKMVTDSQGRVELLTIRPGDYAGRSAHIHLRIYPGDLKHRQMTTQAYICEGNSLAHMDGDIANWWRSRPDCNMAMCWATEAPKDGKPYHGLPTLPEEDAEVAEAISRWNVKLKEDHERRSPSG